MRKGWKQKLLAATGIALGLSSLNVLAAPEEIQVYLDDMNEPGESGVEIHTNYVMKGTKTPGYDGELPTHHVLQVTPEFSYGLTKNWEAGLYLPMAASPNGSLYGNGLKLRMKYIASQEEGARFFWGVNTELGYASRRIAEGHWNAEVRPIIGYRNGPWLLDINPILNLALSPNVSNEPQFEPALKIGREIGNGYQIGIEHYSEFGPIHHPFPAGERSQFLYGVVDINRGPIDINLGIGRGFDAATDKWIAKMIVELPLK